MNQQVIVEKYLPKLVKHPKHYENHFFNVNKPLQGLFSQLQRTSSPLVNKLTLNKYQNKDFITLESSLKSYVDEKFESFQKYFSAELKKTKKSLSHDISNTSDVPKRTVTESGLTGESLQYSPERFKEVSFPISSEQQFNDLEKILKEDPEKKKIS